MPLKELVIPSGKPPRKCGGHNARMTLGCVFLFNDLDYFFAFLACFYLCVLCEEQKIPRKERKRLSRKARKDVISNQ